MDLKFLGYFISTISVVMLAAVALPGPGEPQWHTWVVAGGSIAAEGDLDSPHLYNGNVLVAHPTDPDVLYYLYGTNPQFEENYGALYRVEASTGDITVEAQFGGDIDDYAAIAFNPADPDVIYITLTSERPSEG